jgi:hypothetical protein
METPLDRPRRENGRKQNTNQTHTQQSRRAMKNRKTKKAVGRGCEDMRKIDVRCWRRKAKEKNDCADIIKEARSYKDCSTRRVSKSIPYGKITYSEDCINCDKINNALYFRYRGRMEPYLQSVGGQRRKSTRLSLRFTPYTSDRQQSEPVKRSRP